MSAADGSTRPAERAIFAIPGDLATPTGGYGYARQLFAHGPMAGLRLDHWPLPDGFPEPDTATLEETARRLSLTPQGWPVIVDGLALGVVPPELLRGIDGPLIALCHHPLGLESGLSLDRSAALFRSERAALALCAGVIATSAATAATLMHDFAVPEDRLTVARPGTEPVPPARGSGGDVPQLLSVGALIPRKGHDVLIDALRRVDDLDWTLTIVGPADRDPGCAADLAARIEAAGLSGRVTLAGAADARQLAWHYGAADLFVLASRHEGYGMAFAEALAHGLPVIGCRTGAVAEATQGAACLIAPDDPTALAGALRRLIGQPLARARLAQATRAAAERLPRWPDTAALVAEAVARARADADAV